MKTHRSSQWIQTSYESVTPALLCLLILLCMVFPNSLEKYAIQLPFMKLYYYEIPVWILVFSTGIDVLQKRISFHSDRLSSHVIAYIAVGMISLSIGLFVTGNDFRNAFGDFRRAFFYSVLYWVTLNVTGKFYPLSILRIMIFASLIVLVKGILQFVMGDFSIRREGDAAHILNHFEVTSATLPVLWALTEASIRRTSALTFCILTAGITVITIANFRTGWVALGCAVLVIAALLNATQRKALIKTLLFASVTSGLIITLLWSVPVRQNQLSVGNNIATKANLSATTSDQNVRWRLDSFANAIQLWKTAPVLGRGLGENLTFTTKSSKDEQMVVSGHRVHNSYLWLLMSTGICGFLIFLTMHGKFIVTIIRNADNRPDIIPLFCFYSAIMISANFESYLESTAPAIVLTILMATGIHNVRSDCIISQKPYYGNRD